LMGIAGGRGWLDGGMRVQRVVGVMGSPIEVALE